MEEIKINEIMTLLPHRYPFLLVDKVVSVEGDTIVAIKNVTANEPQFTGHFPENPVLPGVLQLEALAQVGGIFCALDMKSKGQDPKDRLVYFTTINNVKFKRTVIPGDVLRLEIVMERMVERGGAIIMQMKGKATVNGELACQADLGAWVVKRDK